MDRSRIFGIASALGLTALVAFGVFAVAGGLGGDDNAKASTTREAACLEGSDCNDTSFDNGDGASSDGRDSPSQICIAPEEGGDPSCSDTPSGPAGQTCVAGSEECSDGGTSTDLPCAADQPECVSSGSPGGSSGSGGGADSEPPALPGCVEGPDACQAKAVDAAKAALAAAGVTDAKLVSAEYVEWPDSCLGAREPNVACAEIITPGYLVAFDNGVLAFEYHTDLAGHAVLAEPAQ